MSVTDVQTCWRDVSEQAARHAVTCELQLTPEDLGNPRARYACVRLRSLDGCPVEARLIVPAREGSHPVVLAFHDAMRGVRGWQHLTRFVALGYAVLALQNRVGVEGVLVKEPLTVGDGLGVAVRVGAQEPPRLSRTLDDATRQALAATYADALVLAHAAKRIEGLDGDRLVCWGEGLGGGVALAVASLVPAVGAAALNPLPVALDESVADVDVAQIACGLACPVLMGTCLLDLQATPEAQDVLAANLAHVQRLRYPRYTHERVNAFEDELLSFLVARSGESH